MNPASARRPGNLLCRFPKGLNVQDLQGTNTKTDVLMKKLFFRSNSPCITCLFLFFTGRTNIQKFLTGTSTGRLRDRVVGCPGDKMMGHSRDDHGTSVKHYFWKQLTNTLHLLWQVNQDFIVNSSGQKSSKQYRG